MRRAGHVARPAAASRHGSACSPCSTAASHQLVLGRVELDLVDAVAEAVVGAQHRRVLVGLDAPARCALAARRARRARAGGPRPAARPRARPPRRSAVSAANALRPSSGGAWLRTSWVRAASAVERHRGLLSVTDRRQKRDERGDERVGVGVGAARRATAGPTSASPMAPTSAAAVKSASWAGSSPRGDRLARASRRSRRGRRGGTRRRSASTAGSTGSASSAQASRRPRSARRANVSTAAASRPARRRRRGRRAARVDLALRGAPEHLGEQVGLGREVAVDGAGRDAGAARRRRRPAPRGSRRGR